MTQTDFQKKNRWKIGKTAKEEKSADFGGSPDTEMLNTEITMFLHYPHHRTYPICGNIATTLQHHPCSFRFSDAR